MREVPREWLEFMREQYPKGSRIRLIEMADDPHPLPEGSTGTLDHIDDADSRALRDNGRGLALVIGENRFFHPATRANTAEALYAPDRRLLSEKRVGRCGGGRRRMGRPDAAGLRGPDPGRPDQEPDAGGERTGPDALVR